MADSKKLDWAGHQLPTASEIDWGGQAFPTEGGDNSGLYPDPGMSLRDWFAGQALPVLLNDVGDRAYFSEVAKQSYEMADAMIAARKAGA